MYANHIWGHANKTVRYNAEEALFDITIFDFFQHLEIHVL